MSGYWNSAELTFFSGTSENGGWKPMLERYRRHYGNAAEMGRLEFGNVRIESFDDETALARAAGGCGCRMDQPGQDCSR